MRGLPALALWCIALSSAAQPLDFRHLSTADGLTDNTITALHQDRAGFLWVGTQHGLNLYDGHHLWNWHSDDGLAGEHVVSIIEDRVGTLWVGTREGSVAHKAAGSMSFSAHRPVLERVAGGLSITCLFDLDDTTLMIGAERLPISFLDKRTGRFSYWSGTGPITPKAAVSTPQESHDWCHYIADLGDDQLAIGFLLNHQQWVVDRRSGERVAMAFRMDHPDDQTITDIVAHHGELYGVGWQRRIHSTDAIGGHHTWPLPDESTCITSADSLHLLIGTRGNGLLRIQTRTGRIEPFRHDRNDRRSLSDDRISSILTDRDGRIWVGTLNGLNLYDPALQWSRAIPLRPETPHATAIQASSIQAGPDGRSFICTDQGVFIHSPDGTVQHRALHFRGTALQVNCLVPYGTDRLVGCEQGVFSWNERTDEVAELRPIWAFSGTPERPTPGPLPKLFQVRSLMTDTTGGRHILLLGVLGYGIIVLDLDKGMARYILRQPGRAGTIGSNLVRQLARSGDGTIWAATKDGLYRWDTPPDEQEHFTRIGEDGAGMQPILGVLPETNGHAWFTTRNKGLAHWNGSTVSYPPQTHSSALTGLVRDRKGRIWCAREGGVDMLDTGTGRWERHTLPGDDIQRAPTALTLLPDGRMAFVHDDQLHLFDPLQKRPERALPAPYLTGLSLANAPILERLEEGILSLTSNEQLLTVAISALDLAQGDDLRFAITLEGIDPSPRTTTDGTITYASLPAGTHRLLAHTIAGDGRQSAPVVLATIVKAAPIWQRWWFLALLAGIIAVVVYAVTRYRYQQQLKLQAVRVRIASDLHDEVGSSLSSITIGSQLATKLTTEEHQQVRALLQRIGETSSESLRSISDIVWAIDPKNDQGEALVKRMRRVAAELLDSKGIAAVFEVAPEVEELKLPMDVRKELLLIFKEAVHNASKYSQAQQVRVVLQRAGGSLVLRVEDDGHGFDPAIHQDGHGLGSMRRRAEALGAELHLWSTPGSGTRISVEVRYTRIRD